MRDALAAWVEAARTDLAGGEQGLARLRSRVEQRAQAKNGNAGTLSLDIDAAQVFASGATGADIVPRLTSLLGRGQRKLSLAEVASNRRPPS